MIGFKNNIQIYEEESFCLHRFGNLQDPPIFIIPPHAGRHGNITQKLIDSCVDNNRCVYAFELFSATLETRDIGISDLINFLSICINQINNEEPLDIVGVCQGGWLSAIYSCLFPKYISKLALMAAPIDVQADPENQITKFCQIVPYEWFEFNVNLHSGIQPGLSQWLMFAMSSPVEVFFGRHLRKFFAILNDDQKLLDKLNRNDEWYDNPQDLAGKWFLESVYNLFIHNNLVKNEWCVKNQYIDLENINFPLYLYAGEDDEITSYSQLFDIDKYVSSSSIEYHLFPECGHTRVFTGNKELEVFQETFLKEQI